MGKKFIVLYLLSLFIFPISLGLDVPKVGSLKFIRCFKCSFSCFIVKKLMKNLGMWILVICYRMTIDQDVRYCFFNIKHKDVYAYWICNFMYKYYAENVLHNVMSENSKIFREFICEKSLVSSVQENRKFINTNICKLLYWLFYYVFLSSFIYPFIMMGRPVVIVSRQVTRFLS